MLTITTVVDSNGYGYKHCKPPEVELSNNHTDLGFRVLFKFVHSGNANKVIDVILKCLLVA